MAITVAVEHRTTYRFARHVRLDPHLIRLRPAPHTRTPVRSYALHVTPPDRFLSWQQDPFGNHVARAVFPERADCLEIVVDLVLDMVSVNPFDFFLDESVEEFGWRYPERELPDLQPYLRPPGDGEDDAAVDAWLAGCADVLKPGTRTVDALVGLNQRMRDRVDYTVRMEHGVLSPAQTLQRGIGSCRDSAWLLVAALRRLGLAARFVSGYLVQLRPDEIPAGGPAGPATDFTDLHAWAEVYVPGAGWIGLDATSGLFAGEGHIPLAATPAPESAAPVTGAVEAVDVDFSFTNTVRRLAAQPRVTQPYSDEQWEQVVLLGEQVDARLGDADARLTMGGEPTFVSATDMESEQWRTAADGADKRAAARALAGRMLRRVGDGGITMYSQGKWYPGEPLPRWQIELMWRTDGYPLWRDGTLLDSPWARPHAGPERLREAADELAADLGRRLGVPGDCVQPVHEDALYRAWQEAQYPDGPRPEQDVDPAAETDAARLLRERLDAASAAAGPVGWVIPLFRAPDGSRWGTSRWRTRRPVLQATPGTSPLGLRLPLAGVAWTAPVGPWERSPLEPRDPLPRPAAEQLPEPPPATGPLPHHEGVVSAAGALVLDPAAAPRTALVVEPREGHLHVFLPPLTRLEDAVELLAHVEAAAGAAGVPVVLEGYAPPKDDRVRSASVTPDPGVVEVNVTPTASWREFLADTEALYQDARVVGLGAETFDLDGRHSGTGGGSHLTLGGPNPGDSVMLREPGLLASMLTYWQHHPSLSYLFSGRFVGPTSQAPRADEGRPEALYELEVAIAELDRMGAHARPWHADRLFRHLLTDITGNTHRSEFCIDKMYSPDSDRGRLGLLELRGFEMPPHWRLAAVQALLVRSLVARLLGEPYRGRLVRWGTRLHERFLLPQFCAEDLDDVLADLARHGTDMPRAWFEPFVEFRFPLLGRRQVAGVELELRQGIEPWHVLGEEATGTGTARYVDSSVERVQVAVTGAVEGRHVVTCNGRPVPLTATRVPGRLVAGVRYKAWSPPSSLHPTIPAHGPLVFDVVDLWSGRSLGGLTYHVVHPGGRSYDRFPVNAAEAEARRHARITDTHTPATLDSSRWAGEPGHRHWWAGSNGQDYSLTLDLRRAAT